ncbi:MAG TPA: hypothetical protein VF808_02925 [Ktedonobacterales bacterium]
MATYTGQRERDLAVRVRRMLIEQSAIMASDSQDEFNWLTRHYETEQRFFEEELGARLELRMGRWARAYWPAPPRNRDLLIADIFELTARKQTAYACLLRAYRSVRLLEAGDSANVFRFSELFRYVAEEGQRLSPWLSFDEAVINDALATQGDGDVEPEEDDDEEVVTGTKGRKKATTTTRARKPVAAPARAGAAQRVRANQRAFYQAFAAFERRRLVRRIGADDRQRPEERYRLDEHDFSGVYEFTDLIDRFLPPAGLVAYDDLRDEEA